MMRGDVVCPVLDTRQECEGMKGWWQVMGEYMGDDEQTSEARNGDGACIWQEMDVVGVLKVLFLEGRLVSGECKENFDAHYKHTAQLHNVKMESKMMETLRSSRVIDALGIDRGRGPGGGDGGGAGLV